MTSQQATTSDLAGSSSAGSVGQTQRSSAVKGGPQVGASQQEGESRSLVFGEVVRAFQLSELEDGVLRVPVDPERGPQSYRASRRRKSMIRGLELNSSTSSTSSSSSFVFGPLPPWPSFHAAGGLIFRLSIRRAIESYLTFSFFVPEQLRNQPPRPQPSLQPSTDYRDSPPTLLPPASSLRSSWSSRRLEVSFWSSYLSLSEYEGAQR